jgi:hypothetical protein
MNADAPAARHNLEILFTIYFPVPVLRARMT